MLLIDNSVWSRLMSDGIPEAQAEAVVGMFESLEIAACLPFLLEAGYSAQSGVDHERIMDQLGKLSFVPIDAGVEATARKAKRELALVGHHRISSIDLMIAACAHEAGMGILHYDRDYDRILELTSLRFESVWVAPAGSL